MALPTFYEALLEKSPEKEFKLKFEDLDSLEERIELLNKMKKTFLGEPKIETFVHKSTGHPDGNDLDTCVIKKRMGFISQEKDDPNNFKVQISFPYMFPKDWGNGLFQTFENFEEEGEVEFFPDFFSDEGCFLKFTFDENLDPGSLKMKQIYDWKDRNCLHFHYNSKNLDQVVDVVTKALDQSFDQFLKVRIIISPRVIAKHKEFSSELKKEFFENYSKLLFDFKKNGFLPKGLIEEDFFGLTLLKIARTNPKYLEILRELPTAAIESWFNYACKFLKTDYLDFDEDSVKTLQKIYNLKSAWDLI